VLAAAHAQVTLAGGLLVGGIIAIAGASVGLLTVSMNRRTTRKWGDADLSDSSYRGTFQRTIYRAYRVKFYGWFLAAMYAIGVGLLVASGIAKLLG